MKKTSPAAEPANPIVQALKHFIGKLRQNPDVYPIRYYKKSRRFKRHWQGPLVK